MSFYNVPFEELRIECRQKLETCEIWLRRLIDEHLNKHYGNDYFNYTDAKGQNLIKKEIRDHAESMMNGNPGRYRSKVDTLLFESLVYILCKQELYDNIFSNALRYAFPDGRAEAHTFLDRLTPIRNKLSHANPISVYEAERVFCYCDDIINGLKEYYKDRKMNQEYNAPLFTRLLDSLGHSEIPNSSQVHYYFTQDPILRPGDIISCEFEVDSSFVPDEYSIFWTLCDMQTDDNEKGTGINFSLPLKTKHVGEQLNIQITLTSNKDWHRHGSFDARMTLSYKVLPPLI